MGSHTSAVWALTWKLCQRQAMLRILFWYGFSQKQNKLIVTYTHTHIRMYSYVCMYVHFILNFDLKKHWSLLTEGYFLSSLAGLCIKIGYHLTKQSCTAIWIQKIQGSPLSNRKIPSKNKHTKTHSLSYTAFLTSLRTHPPRPSNTQHLSSFKSGLVLEPSWQAVLFVTCLFPRQQSPDLVGFTWMD